MASAPTAPAAEAEREVYDGYVREWKAKGGLVLGYACVATPVELIEAAGILPYRIRALGNPRTDLADGEMSLFNCSFCRSCLQLALDGTYDFLDGIIETNGCDHLRAMFENWQHRKGLPFFHYLKVPHFYRDDSLAYFEGELALLRDHIASHFDAEASEASLRQAVADWNLVREKWRELCALREEERPRLSGSEALELELAGSRMTGRDFARLLSGFLEERRNAPGMKPAARLMLCGPATDEVEWLQEMEDLGAAIVSDTLCFGSRAFLQRPELDGDPLRNLASGYLGTIFCPRMYKEYGKRRDYIVQTAERSRVDGAVYIYNKFCDLHGVDSVLVRRDLERAGIPVLVLEKEYSAASDAGRTRTRVQAFLERIGCGV